MFHKKYRALFKISIQDCLAYRSAYIFGIMSRFVAMVTLFYIWRALFAGQAAVNGYTWDEMRTYLFITFGVNSFISWGSEAKVSMKIRDGSIAMDLLKPYDYQKTQLAGTLGGCAAEIVVALGFCVLLLSLFGGVGVPPDALSSLFFGVSAVFSFLIKFGIVYLFGLLCFYTTASTGLRWARGAITDLFSGALIPITFFPPAMLAMSRILPFQGIVFIPASIYMGTAGGPADILGLLAFQAAWAAALWFSGKLFWRVAVRQVTIAGG
jgi:ABC-2 type transport system permease protein